MASEPISLTFSGPETEGGHIDGRRLGEALVAFTTMLDVAKSADPAFKSSSLRLVVEVNREGSFDIQAILEGIGTAWEAFAAWAEGRNGVAVTQLEWFLTTILSVLAYIKATPKKDQAGLSIDMPDGTKVELSPEALRILSSGAFVRAARDFVEVLDDDVDKVEVRTSGQAVRLEAADVPTFRALAATIDDPTEQSEVREVTVSPAQAVLDGSGKWKVREYGSVYTATMSDQDFIQLVQVDNWPVARSDEYRVRVESTQHLTPTGQRRWDNTIVEVLGYRKAPGEPFRGLPKPRVNQDEI